MLSFCSERVWMTIVRPGPNASDLLSLMETGLLDLLKAEISCSLLYPVHLPQNRGCSLASNNTHSSEAFSLCAWPKPFHRVNLCVMNTDRYPLLMAVAIRETYVGVQTLTQVVSYFSLLRYTLVYSGFNMSLTCHVPFLSLPLRSLGENWCCLFIIQGLNGTTMKICHSLSLMIALFHYRPSAEDS